MSDVLPVRVGDRERGEADALLRDALADGVLTLTEYDERAAACWAARTRPELDAVVADLPLLPAALDALAWPPGSVAVPAQARSAEPVPRPARGLARRAFSGALALAVAAGGLYVGAGVVTADQRSVFSSSEQTVQPGDLDDRVYEAGVLFGSVTVVVPDGVRAQLSGTMVFGSSACDTACARTADQVLQIRGTGAFGSIEVVTEAEARADGLDADDD